VRVRPTTGFFPGARLHSHFLLRPSGPMSFSKYFATLLPSDASFNRHASRDSETKWRKSFRKENFPRNIWRDADTLCRVAESRRSVHTVGSGAPRRYDRRTPQPGRPAEAFPRSGGKVCVPAGAISFRAGMQGPAGRLRLVTDRPGSGARANR